MTMMTMDNLTQPVCGSNMEAHIANGGNGMPTASDFTARAEMLDGHQQQRQQQHQKVGQQQQQQQQPREPQHGPRLPVCDVSASGTAQQKEADGAAATVGRAERAERRGERRDVRWRQQQRRKQREEQQEQQQRAPRRAAGGLCGVCAELGSCRCDR